MADIHIEDFFKDVALIFNQLFSLFPRKAAVFVEDIAGPDAPDEYGLHCPRHEACFGAMLWLADEGYLRFESTIRREAIDQSILTHKAFLMLSAISSNELANTLDSPSFVGLPSDQRTNINMIRLLLKSGTSTQLANAMHQLFLQQKS